MADWGGLIGTILGGVSGLAENLFGEDLEKQALAKEQALGDAPKMDIPQSQLDYEQLAATRARQAMPGSTDMLSQIDAQAAYQGASAGRVAGSQFGAMGGANLAQANRSRQLRQLGIGQDMYRSQAEQAAIEARAGRGAYEQAQFEYNEFIPWQIAKNEIASLRGAGQQQLMSGLDSTAAAGIYGSQMFGGNNQSYNQQGSMLPQQQYNYGAMGGQMQQMGASQVAPATGLGTDPYYNY